MIALRKTAEDANTITLAWTPVPGATGYRFTAEKLAKPSHTWDPQRSSVRIAKGSAWYTVEALGIADEGSYPPAEVPDLRWPRPTLEDAKSFVASNAKRSLDGGGGDWAITFAEPITAPGGLTVKNCRRVTIIGGEIRNDVPYASGSTGNQYGLYLLGPIAHCHVEGVKIHGTSVGQAIAISPDWTAAQRVVDVIRVQHCRLETLHAVGAGLPIHTDGIQAMGGPCELGLYNVSIRSTGLSLQMAPREHAQPVIRGWHYERVDMRHLSAGAPALNKSWSGLPWWPEFHKDVYLEPNPGHSQPIMVNWSNDPDGWDPAGGTNVSGEALHIGRPPADFCPA